MASGGVTAATVASVPAPSPNEPLVLLRPPYVMYRHGGRSRAASQSCLRIAPAHPATATGTGPAPPPGEPSAPGLPPPSPPPLSRPATASQAFTALPPPAVATTTSFVPRPGEPSLPRPCPPSMPTPRPRRRPPISRRSPRPPTVDTATRHQTHAATRGAVAAPPPASVNATDAHVRPPPRALGATLPHAVDAATALRSAPVKTLAVSSTPGRRGRHCARFSTRRTVGASSPPTVAVTT